MSLILRGTRVSRCLVARRLGIILRVRRPSPISSESWYNALIAIM